MAFKKNGPGCCCQGVPTCSGPPVATIIDLGEDAVTQTRTLRWSAIRAASDPQITSVLLNGVAQSFDPSLAVNKGTYTVGCNGQTDQVLEVSSSCGVDTYTISPSCNERATAGLVSVSGLPASISYGPCIYNQGSYFFFPLTCNGVTGTGYGSLNGTYTYTPTGCGIPNSWTKTIGASGLSWTGSWYTAFGDTFNGTVSGGTLKLTVSNGGVFFEVDGATHTMSGTNFSGNPITPQTTTIGSFIAASQRSITTANTGPHGCNNIFTMSLGGPGFFYNTSAFRHALGCNGCETYNGSFYTCGSVLEFGSSEGIYLI